MRAFLAFVESRGGGDVLARELAEAIGADGARVRAALEAEGVIRGGPRATTVACDGIECAREVRELEATRGPGPRLVAVCTRNPRDCETIHVNEDELAQIVVDVAALLTAVRRALRIDAPLRAARTKGFFAGDEEPVLLGELVDGARARDVFFARCPSAPAFRALLAERRAHPRPALVLVPTARGIDPAVLGAARGAHVEIAALADRVAVRGGRLVASGAGTLRVVDDEVRRVEAQPSSNDVARAASGKRVALGRLPRATRWNQVTFYGIDAEDAIGVQIGERHAKLTAIDLGMADARTRAPVRAFDLLKRICDGNGVFDTRPWGSAENGRKVVSELRIALKKGFGIAGAAIGKYSYGAKAWKPAFHALAAAPRVVREMEARLAREE